MMFDTAASFGQPTLNASQFTPHGLPGVFPGQYGQLTGQAIAACLAAQQIATLQHLAAQQQLAAQLGPFGLYAQSFGGWPALQQSILGHFGQQPFVPALGLHGLSGVPYWQSIGALPVSAQIAGQLAGGVGRSFQPFQSVPQMAYAG